MNEVWKPINGYEGKYEVSSLGSVRSLDRYQQRKDYRSGKQYQTFKKGSLIMLHQGKNGYMRAKIFDKKGNHKMALVHRLVAAAFIPNPNNLPEVNHKDEVKTNNRLENLEWCSGSYNKTYNNLQSRRYDSGGGRRKRAVEQLTMDGQFIARHDSITKAAKAVGTSVAHIWNVCDGRQKSSCGYRWRYVE